jgi:hypothetical protein
LSAHSLTDRKRVVFSPRKYAGKYSLFSVCEVIEDLPDCMVEDCVAFAAIGLGCKISRETIRKSKEAIAGDPARVERITTDAIRLDQFALPLPVIKLPEQCLIDDLAGSRALV